MTEAEWLTCEDPRPMIDLLRDRADSRKWQLFAVASCSDVLSRYFKHRKLQFTVKCGERAIDEHVPDEDWKRARAGLDWGRSRRNEPLNLLIDAVHIALGFPYLQTVEDGRRVVGSISESLRISRRASEGDEEFRFQADALRCIFGNPFYQAYLKPAWRTTTAIQLAQQMYDSRDSSAMPILADALQDAGCDTADILDHCRGPGPHVRGCWVVDLVLGKS